MHTKGTIIGPFWPKIRILVENLTRTVCLLGAHTGGVERGLKIPNMGCDTLQISRANSIYSRTYDFANFDPLREGTFLTGVIF